MTEVELAQKFIDYFNDDGYEVYKEVPSNGIIDIVAKSGNITVAIEVKVRLSFEVIEQAYRHLGYTTYVYVAVPHTKGSFAHHICSQLGIGVLEYNPNQYYGVTPITQIVKPKIFRKSKFLKLKLEEWMKQSVAGSQNDRQTAFKNTISEMVKYIKRHPGCTLTDCLKNVDFHWSNITSAKGCVYQWIQKGIIKEFRLEKGILKLNNHD